MTHMSEYIDKTEAMRRFKPFGREIPKEQVMAVLARINEGIVRCKGCKYWHSNTEFCDQFSHKSAGIAQRMSPDNFCSYGERSEEE